MTRVDLGKTYTKTKLDVKDKKILDLLTENSRMPATQIAKKVMVSRDVVNYKIKRLEKEQIINNFYSRLNFQLLGYQVFHIFFMVDDSKNVTELIEELKNHNRTYSLFEYSDHWDLEWVLIVKDIQQLDKIVTKIQSKFTKTILERSEELEINLYSSIVFANHFNKTPQNPKKIQKLSSKLDIKDIKILEQITNNSKISTYEIAPKVELSADAVGLRLKKLYNSDIIRKYTIEPNFSKLGYNWKTVCLKMKHYDEIEENKFKTFVQNSSGIIRAVKMFGNWDVLLYIAVEHQSDFHKLIKSIKSEFSTILKNYNTFVSYKEHIFTPFPKTILEDFENKEN